MRAFVFFVSAGLSTLLFLGGSGGCGGGGGTRGGANSMATVTITGTLAVSNLAALRSRGLIKNASEPSDFTVLAISGAPDDEGEGLEQEMVEATVNADGSFTIEDLPDGTTAVAIVDAEGDNHKLVGLVKFGDYGVINTASSSADDTIDLGTVTYDGATGFATSGNDADLEEIRDTTTPITESVILDNFGATASDAGGTGEDSDGDATEDDLDFERDGDGVPDALDRDGDGDGILNQIEGDSFSTCRYIEPHIFINNKVPIGSADSDEYVLTVNVDLMEEADDLNVSSVRITSPGYISNNTEVWGSPANCNAAEGEGPFDFTGELLDATATMNKFCGFIASQGEATTMQDSANSGDLYVFEMTATDGSGAAVTETCTMQLSYVLKTIPQNILIDGTAASPAMVNLPDNDFTITWETPSGIPDGFSYRFDVDPMNANCQPLPGTGMKFPQGDDWVVPTTESITISLADADLTSASTMDDKFPNAEGATNPADFSGCWRFDLTIQDEMNDNSSQSSMAVCRAGGNCTP